MNFPGETDSKLARIYTGLDLREVKRTPVYIRI